MPKAAILTGLEQPLEIHDVELDKPHAREVKVRMGASGVCHSDLSVQNGTLMGVAPIVLGHEGAGVVEEVGEGVTSVKPGDHVVISWVPQCGDCYFCQHGQGELCKAADASLASGGLLDGTPRFSWNGAPLSQMAASGTFSEVSVIPESGAVKIPDDVDMKVAALIGCGVLTGVGAALNTADIKKGDTVAVVGCGGVGLNVIQGARIAGAAVIVAVDVAEARLDTARRFGATHTVRATRGDDEMRDVVAAVRGIAGARGADYAFECTAVPALGAAPLRMIRHGGTAVQVSGIEQVIPVDMELFEFDKTYVNPLYGNCRPSVDFPRLLELHRRGDLLLDELVTRTYALDDLDAAFDDLLAGRNAKGVIVLSDVA
jgi:S-(hydroxymethyl)glutathione dehydrogenase / alcohol dehydrogenase